jgi:hypothetical protein
MAGEAEILSLLDEAMGEKGLSLDILAGAMSDNAMTNTMATLNAPGLAFHAHNPQLWDDNNKETKIGCISHLANLAVIYAIGDKVAKRDGENSIPAGPDNADVQKVFQSARESSEWLSNEKNFQRADTLATERNLRLLQPSLSNVTRWTSQFNMLRRSVDNFPVLSLVKDEKRKTVVLSIGSATAMAQFEAILEPLTIFQRLTQSSDRPFGPATLPAIFTLLRRYGIKVPSLLYPDDGVTMNNEEVQFQVRDPVSPYGETKYVRYCELLSESRSLFCSIQRHLEYRFLKQRSNRRFFEVAGMFVHPVMKAFAKKVCGDGDGMFNFAAMKKEVATFVNRFQMATTESTEAAFRVEERQPTIDEEVDSDAGDICERKECELSEFLKFPEQSVEHLMNKLNSFRTFTELFEGFDPLAYWSNAKHRSRFPAVYDANMITLAYQSSSAFQESLFSTSGLTLTDVRNRLYESPMLAEAVVTLRHSFAREIAQKRRQLKAQRGQGSRDDDIH